MRGCIAVSVDVCNSVSGLCVGSMFRVDCADLGVDEWITVSDFRVDGSPCMRGDVVLYVDE